MKAVAIDYETFYDDEVSIRTLGAFNYTRHPLTRAYIVSVVAETGEKFVGHPDEFDFHAISGPDWQVVHHNASFDTEGYARLREENPEAFPPFFNPPECTADLSAYLGSPRSLKDAAKFLLKKDASKDVRNKMKGKSWEEMTPEFREEVKAYALYDSELCLEIWLKFNHLWPEVERNISRLTRKMSGRGVPVEKAHLEMGREIMEKALDEARTQIPWGEPILSKPQLDAHCETLGIPAPKSLAKTSEEFAAWLEKYGEEHKFAAAVSRYRKANVALSRVNAMLSRTREENGQHWMDYGLMYFGATTTGRWSGGDGFNCVTGDHEVLTPEGWVRLSDWDNARQQIMQWHVDGSLSFTFGGKVNAPYRGDLIQISTARVQLLATPNHRVVCKRSNGGITEHPARKGLQSTIRNIPVTGFFHGGSGIERTDDELKLLVALAADGSVNKKGRVSFGFKRKRKISRLRSILQKTGLCFVESEEKNGATHFAINKSQRPTWLKKGFGNWLLNLSHQQAKVVLSELKHWDGSVNPKSGATMFYSGDRDQAEWITTLAHIHGQPTSLNSYSEQKISGKEKHYVYFLSEGGNQANPKEHTNALHFDGIVYCPQVPTGMFLTRYAGRIHVTGNSQNQNKKPVEGYEQRHAIRAPEGYRLLICDYSQIEPRVLTWLAGDTKTLEFMVQTSDFYEAQARSMGLWNKPEPLKTDPDLRHMIKGFSIGLGYMMSAGKFAEITGVGAAEAERLVELYRSKSPKIRALWSKLQTAFRRSTGKKQFEIELPTGRILRYFEPKATSLGDTTAVMCRRVHGKEVLMRVKIWPGLLTENLTQATAREVMAYAMPRIEEAGYPVLLTVHDELVTLIREDKAEESEREVVRLMTETPDWAKGLTLTVESHISERYEK